MAFIIFSGYSKMNPIILSLLLFAWWTINCLHNTDTMTSAYFMTCSDSLCSHPICCGVNPFVWSARVLFHWHLWFVYTHSGSTVLRPDFRTVSDVKPVPVVEIYLVCGTGLRWINVTQFYIKISYCNYKNWSAENWQRIGQTIRLYHMFAIFYLDIVVGIDTLQKINKFLRDENHC